MEYNEKNGISKYTSIESQVLFCVTVLNHNNIQNNRYRKLLFSILQQKYDNYHIVFIDDSSDDNSLYMFK
jgi:glycosyltransferase involved in cell wall biosynthesis